MRKDKNLAVRLREQGKSYGQISKTLNIPKSTLSYWLRDIKLSKEAENKISDRVCKTSIALLIKRNKQQTALAEERARKIRQEAKTEAVKLMENPLFVAGIALYWAEGYKKGAAGSKWKSVSFANSDPTMVKLMMSFFRDICRIDDKKIKIQLLLHPNVGSEKAVSFWSGLTAIPKKQFMKSCHSVSKSSQGKRSANSLPYGTVHVRINDVGLFYKIIGWIDGLQGVLINSF